MIFEAPSENLSYGGTGGGEGWIWDGLYSHLFNHLFLPPSPLHSSPICLHHNLHLELKLTAITYEATKPSRPS